MDYEKAWKELRGVIQRDYDDKNDDIPAWIYQTILESIDNLEIKYDTRYTCIKSNGNLIKGKKYEVIDQDQNYIWVDVVGGNLVPLTYKEFEECFKKRS